MKYLNKQIKFILGALILSSPLLFTNNTFADSSATVDITINIPVTCTMSITAGSNITTNVTPGQNNLIGTSSLKTLCNDGAGFAIYAIGYTGNVHGDNNLRKEESGNTLSTTTLIPTGVASSPSASQWNMTVSDNTSVSGNFSATIPSAFQSAHEVPTNQTLIASYPSTTDQTTGSNINVNYNAYIASNQVAGSYKSKVKYTLVHPAVHEAPASRPATLDTGQTVNSKMKSLAKTVATGTTSTVAYNTSDSYIKAIDVHTSTNAPSGFTPSEANTISSSASEHPIYIVFDNANNAGIMNLYTLGDKIVLPADSSYMFHDMDYLADISDLADLDVSNVTNMLNLFNSIGSSLATNFSLDLSSWNWDTSNVTNMSGMFAFAGYNATTFSLNLPGWDTSSVTDMSGMFASASNNATSWSINGLSNLDTSSVTTMGGMFSNAGTHVSTFSLDLSNWELPNIENLSGMLSSAGEYATTFSLDLSNWKLSNTTSISISGMLSRAGYNASTFSADLSGWNTSNITNTFGLFSQAGYNASTFSADLSGWDTSSVTSISYMFSSAGPSATTWSVIIPQTNGGNINNTASYIYGQTSSIYDTPPSGKSFTLAQ